MSEGFARPDMAEGQLWIETPQTETAMITLFRVLDVSRRDDPGWQPIWVLCGDRGVGKSHLARRFAAQAQRAVACDAMREAEEAHGQPTGRPRIPSPETLEARDRSWADYRAFQAMSPEERVRRFGSCPRVCRPAEFLPQDAIRTAVERAREADPVIVGAMEPRPKQAGGFMHSEVWRSVGNRTNDRLRRTSLVMIDDADHVTRMGEAARSNLLDEMMRWPARVGASQPITFLLIGSEALAEAVATFRPVRRIALPAMGRDGPGGTFAKVCDLVFGKTEPGELERLHQGSNGAMGPLLNLARLQGLEAPFNVHEGDILRLPAPERG